MPPRGKRVQTVDTYKRLETGALSSIGAAAVQLTDTSVKTKQGVLVKADSTNAGMVYIGDSTVTAGTPDSTSGFPIAASEWVEIEISDVSFLYAIASEADQKIYWIMI